MAAVRTFLFGVSPLWWWWRVVVVVVVVVVIVVFIDSRHGSDSVQTADKEWRSVKPVRLSITWVHIELTLR